MTTRARSEFLLSDSKQLCSRWKARFGKGRQIEDTFNDFFVDSGTHKISEAELLEVNASITKERLNFEMLRDFNVMLNARNVIGDGVSFFSKMATKAHASGVNFCKFE